MTNGLKKLISILSASAIALSIMPMALAEDVEIAEATVYYEENFDDIPNSDLTNMTQELSNNTSYEDSKGMTFTSAHRSNGDYYQIKLNCNGGVLEFACYKYADATRMPKIWLSRTTGITFANDVVVTMDAKFPAADKSIVVKDSAGTSISVTAPSADYANQWLTITLASTDEHTYKLVKDMDGNVVLFETITTVLSDVEQITVPTATFSGLYFDNLYIADEAYEIPDEVVLDAAMNQITIAENQPGMTVEDDVYIVQRDVSLPTQPEGAILEWTLEQSEDGENWTETSYARVSGDKLIVEPTEDSVNYLVKLTANVACGDLTGSKEFLFRVVAPDPNAPVVYYDETFEGFPSGTLVDFNTSSNTLYESTSGMTFTCGTRDGDNGVTGASIAGSDDKYLNLFQTKHTGQSRQPVVTLSRTNGVEFKNNVVIKFDVTFASTGVTLNIADSSNNVLEIAAPSEAVLNTWISVEICKQGGSTVIVMSDEGGNIIKLYTDNVKLSDVKTISTPDVTYSLLYIDDLYIADEQYAISDETIVEAGANALVINTQANLAANGDEFDAKGDFAIPENPELTTVEWAVEQKAVDSDVWEASSFMSVSGTKVTINPTNEIGNYDTRLVATVACGEATATKTFVINLPNPMNDIAGVLASGYEVVESTDYTDATNTAKLTYDLDGEETLKFDLVLPSKVAGYKNCTIEWTSSNEKYISIKNGITTIMTDDLEEHDVTLTAVVTYAKGNLEYSSEPQNFDIKVGYTEEDIEDEAYYKGKYKTRFDAAYDDTFEDIPEETISNIDLPTEGYFGSDISWSSSAPSIISNSGVVKRASSNKTVTLTASITCGAGSAEKEFKVDVPKKNTSGGGGGGGGSTSSTGTISNVGNSGSIAASGITGTPVTNSSAEEVVSQLQEEAAVANDLFKDLSSAAWAREAINALAEKGIVNGKSDTEFAPNDTVTRAEFAKMLINAFGLNAGAYRTSSFVDVSTSAWYFNSVETAYNLGIINGIGNGKFAPNALITRQDMAVMIVRAANISGVALTEVEAAISFADAASISDYAKAPVSTLQKSNVINGVSDTEFAPLENATRAQSAQIIYNMLSLIG